VKIYAAALAALKKEGGQNKMKVSLSPKNGAFMRFNPTLEG